MECNFHIRATLAIEDYWAIAALRAYGITDYRLEWKDGRYTAVYEDGINAGKALQLFKAHKLLVDAADLCEALDELEWRTADEQYIDAHRE